MDEWMNGCNTNNKNNNFFIIHMEYRTTRKRNNLITSCLVFAIISLIGVQGEMIQCQELNIRCQKEKEESYNQIDSQKRILTIADLFGLAYLFENMGMVTQVTNPDGSVTNSYTVTPSVFAFLSTFQTRTKFCDYKCVNFYNLPCFLLFNCNIQLRNFFLIFILPVIAIIFIGCCCGKGYWTFSCWLKYFMYFTGIALVIWFFKKIYQGQSISKRRLMQKSVIQKQFATMLKSSNTYPSSSERKVNLPSKSLNTDTNNL